MNVDLLFDGSEILDIRLPAHVNLKVVETEPGIKGNTATGATKPAKVETEYLVQVPLFVVEGDILKLILERENTLKGLNLNCIFKYV